jgi:hypothetical protein
VRRAVPGSLGIASQTRGPVRSRWSERRSALHGHAAASTDGHVSHDADRFASTRLRRAAAAREVRSAGTASPVPKYISLLAYACTTQPYDTSQDSQPLTTALERQFDKTAALNERSVGYPQIDGTVNDPAVGGRSATMSHSVRAGIRAEANSARQEEGLTR